MEDILLWSVCVILLVLWLLGFSGSYATGGFHILLVVAVIVLIVSLIQRRWSLACLDEARWAESPVGLMFGSKGT